MHRDKAACLNVSDLTLVYQSELSNLTESNIPSAAFSTDAPSTGVRQRGLHLPHHPNHVSQRAALLMAGQHSLRGARATNPQPPGQPSPAQHSWTWTQLKSGQSLCLVLGWRISGLWVSEKPLMGFFFVKASTQHSSAARHIPPAVRSSRGHQSCLYYQDFLKHTVPTSIGPFSHTIKRADIKFSKYPSF